MAKRKKPHKAETPAKAPAQTKKRISLLGITLAAATLLGGLVAALALLPRISVVASDPVDPANPFSSSFTITNNNFIPLHHVAASLGVGQIVAEPSEPIPGFVPTFKSRLTSSHWGEHTLRMDEKFTISGIDIVIALPPTRLSAADIAIVVSYRPWLLPIRREQVFRFVLRRQTNGQSYWYSQPLE